jgi:hypothetical protein
LCGSWVVPSVFSACPDVFEDRCAYHTTTPNDFRDGTVR